MHFNLFTNPILNRFYNLDTAFYGFGHAMNSPFGVFYLGLCLSN